MLIYFDPPLGNNFFTNCDLCFHLKFGSPKRFLISGVLEPLFLAAASCSRRDLPHGWENVIPDNHYRRYVSLNDNPTGVSHSSL